MNGGYGAGMYMVQSTPIINNCYFDSNINTGYSGGAICMQNSSTRIANSKFTANAIKPVFGPLRGGAIANLNSQLKIENCIFTNNSITSNGVNEETYGGAIYNEGRSDTALPAPEINNCSFISNSSVNFAGNAYGAGVYNLYYSTVITNCAFTHNLVYSSDSFSGYGSCGGGIFNIFSLVCVLHKQARAGQFATMHIQTHPISELLPLIQAFSLEPYIAGRQVSLRPNYTPTLSKGIIWLGDGMVYDPVIDKRHEATSNELAQFRTLDPDNFNDW